MTKLALAATFAAALLTSFSAIPANAQPGPNDVPSTVPPCTAQCGDQGGGGAPADPDCGGQIGALKRVLPAQVQGVNDDYRVWVTEFCLSSSLMRSDGNAAYLRTAIADNDVLADVLSRHGYNPEDVFAVKMMGDETINLYVHRFER
jgi:hypothetical protein